MCCAPTSNYLLARGSFRSLTLCGPRRTGEFPQDNALLLEHARTSHPDVETLTTYNPAPTNQLQNLHATLITKVVAWVSAVVGLLPFLALWLGAQFGDSSSDCVSTHRVVANGAMLGAVAEFQAPRNTNASNRTAAPPYKVLI